MFAGSLFAVHGRITNTLAPASQRSAAESRLDALAAGSGYAVTEFSKLASSLLLVGAGFFAASLFGPPDLMDRLAQRLRPSAGQSTSWLEPIAAAPSGPPLRDPTQSVQPLSPLPQTVPSVPAIQASHPATQGAAGEAATATASADSNQAFATPAAAGANDWFNQASDWPAAPARNAPAPNAPAPNASAPAPAATSPWPAAVSAAPDEPATADSNPWGDPWPAAPQLTAQPSAPAFPPSSTQPSAPAEPYAAAKPVAPSPRPAPQPALGTHIVTDGDTLARLAERYLGDSARAQEIYNLNTDRLDSPELLPIGVVLRVPDEPRGQPATLAPPGAFPTAPPQRDPFTAPSLVGSPVAQDANQFTAIGFHDGPSLTPPPAAAPPSMDHRPSRLVPVGDHAEAAAPLPTIQQGSGETYTPRTIDEWQW